MEIASKVFSLGNSNAIRLPHLMMEALSLKAGDAITLEILNHQELLVRKRTVHTAYPSIRELFTGYSGGYEPVEMEADDGIGKELL